MRVQHVIVVALLAAVCCVAGSAISREEKEPVPALWRRLAQLPKEQRKLTLNSLLGRAQRNALDDKIIAIIEACIKNPALDPVEIPFINIAIQEDFANFTGHMDTVSLNGISTLTVDNFHIGLLLLKLDFALTLPSLSLRGNYDLNGVFAGLLPIYGKGPFTLTLPSLSLRGNYDLNGVFAGLLPIYGKGPFTLSVTNFTVKGVVSVKLSGGSVIVVKTMSIQLGLDSFLFDFKYLLGSEELSDVVNEMINDLGMAFLNKYKLSIETAISETITTAVNSAGITIGDITGGEGGPSFCSAA